MADEKLVPKLRFNGFTDEWSEHKFENIFDIKNGLNKGKDYFGEGIQILNYMDVNKYELNTENTIKGLVELTDDEIERYSVKPNDLFFTRTSETSEEIGLTSAYMGNTIKCVFSGFLLRARPKIDVNSLFFAYYLRSPRQRNNIIKFSSITTRALISGGNLSKMKIKYPGIEEQNKIANLFLILDKKVELLEKKYREYQCFKKYLMQKLFAQELRFANFDDDWEIKKLGNIVEFLDNKRIPLNEDERNNQKDIYPYYGASGIIDYVEDYIFDEELILIGEDGTIDVNLASGKYWVSNHAHVLRANKNINQHYLLEFLKTVHFEIYNTGTIQPKLNKETCKSIPIKIPESLEEQKLIANCLFEASNRIKICQKQIDITNKFKKGLLQQMFI